MSNLSRSICYIMHDPLRNSSQSSINISESSPAFSRLHSFELPTIQGKSGERVGCCGTSNLRALWGLLLLNTSFAVAQMVGAAIANSISMFSDSGSMLVDSFAYLLNLGMEKRKIKYGVEASKLFEVFTSIISVTLLVVVTISTVVTAAQRLVTRSGDDKEVDGRFVFGFSFGNLLIDIAMCFNYCFQLRHRRQASFKEQVRSETKEQLHMVAAFVHLFADTMRTITGLVAGSLEQDEAADSIFIDAIATFCVCGLILFAASFVVYEAVVQYREYRAAKRATAAGETGINDEEGFGFPGSNQLEMVIS